MNPPQLLAHFGQICDAPDAISRLRRFVLDLAVRGKLISQNVKDKPSEELLELISKETTDQRHLPKGWIRAKVGTLLVFQYGKGLPTEHRADEGSVPVFGSNGIVGFTTISLTKVPSIIVGRKGSAGALNLCNGPSWTTDVAYFVEAPAFIELHFLKNALTALNLGSLGKGVKPGLSRSDAYEQLICIPPIAEQRRIVARVDELMALCDRLEAARAQQENSRARLTSSSFARLDVPIPGSFPDDARYVLDILPALTVRPDQIKQIRQSVLNLAMRGKLTAQNANDGSASTLLERVAEEIAAYLKSNRLGMSVIEPITDSALPFTPPAGWQWARMCALFKVITDGDHQPPPRADNGVAFLTIGNVTTGRLDFTGCRLVSDSYFRSLAPYRTPEKGDILYTVVGATYGRAALVQTDREFCVQRHIAILKPAPSMNLRFLVWMLSSPLVYDQASRSTTGSAQPTIALRPLRNFAVPVPPIAEQERIVAQVDKLMCLCERWSGRLGHRFGFYKWTAPLLIIAP